MNKEVNTNESNNFIINNPDLANELAALAVLCAKNNTDSCEIIIDTNKGKFKCNILFEDIKTESEKE
jgi:predicted secreted protein